MTEPAPTFRFTRESRIRIDRDGVFWHEGERVVHPGLARGLASWITIDPATDRYILRNTLDWCFITVDDAPLVVQGVSFRDDGAAYLALSDSTVEPLDASTLRLDADDVPYCDVHGAALPARFSRHAAFVLLEHVQDSGAGPTITLRGQSVGLRRVGRGEGAPRREPAHPDA